MKRALSLGFVLCTWMAVAALPVAAHAAEGVPEAAPACVPEVAPDEAAPAPALGVDPLAEAVPQALCVAQAQCSTGGPVSCSGSRCAHLDWCYAWCDGVYYWCAPPPGIYCPPLD